MVTFITHSLNSINVNKLQAAPGKAKEKMNKAGVEDLVLMSKINEENIVENLKKRYFADIIYVRSLSQC